MFGINTPLIAEALNCGADLSTMDNSVVVSMAEIGKLGTCTVVRENPRWGCNSKFFTVSVGGIEATSPGPCLSTDQACALLKGLQPAGACQ